MEEDIPALTWKKDALGKNKPTAVSQEAKNDYLLEVLKVQTDRLKWVQGETNSTPSQIPPKNQVPQGSPKEAFEPATTTKKEDYSNLPF